MTACPQYYNNSEVNLVIIIHIHMGLIATIVLGGIAGWLGSKLMHTDGSQGILLNIVVGIIGAYIGGYLFSFLGYAGTTGFNLYSLGVSVVGSVVFIWILKMIRG